MCNYYLPSQCQSFSDFKKTLLVLGTAAIFISFTDTSFLVSSAIFATFFNSTLQLSVLATRVAFLRLQLCPVTHAAFSDMRVQLLSYVSYT